MRRLLGSLVIAFAVSSPVFAEETDAESLMERGAQMLLEGLLQQMEPALDDLQGLAEEIGPALQNFAAEMGPAFRSMLDEIEDWSLYHPPEMLDNGDIIIRRKEAAEPPVSEDEIEI